MKSTIVASLGQNGPRQNACSIIFVGPLAEEPRQATQSHDKVREEHENRVPSVQNEPRQNACRIIFVGPLAEELCPATQSHDKVREEHHKREPKSKMDHDKMHVASYSWGHWLRSHAKPRQRA